MTKSFIFRFTTINWLFAWLPACALAAELSFSPPAETDAATATFIEAFASNPALAEADLAIRTFPGAALGRPLEMPELVLQGVVDMALIPGEVLVRTNPDDPMDLLGPVTQQGLAPDPRDAFAIQASALGDAAEMELGETGLIVISPWFRPGTSVVTSLAAESLTRRDADGQVTLDIAGLKVRAGSGTSIGLLEELGARPQVMPGTEVFTARTTGAIDAGEFRIYEDSPALGLFETMPRGTVIGDFGPQLGYLVTSHEVWTSLTPRQARALEQSARQAAEAAKESVVLATRQIPALAASRRLEFVSLSSGSTQVASAAAAAWRPADVAYRSSILADLNTILSSPDVPVPAPPVKLNSGPADDATLFFITNRNHVDDPDLRLSFGAALEPDVSLSCGQAVWQHDQAREFGTDFEEPVVLGGTGLSVGAEDCARLFAGAAEAAGEMATIFIHGFNTDFSDSIGRSIAVIEDLELSGPVFLWAWPSEGTKSGYVRDGQAVEFTEFHLSQFLDALRGLGGLPDVTLIAHSMGSRVALDLLGEIDAGSAEQIGNLVFVAPDVPQPLFRQSMRNQAAAADMITLYSNEHDWPLIGSRKVNKLPAAGSGGKHLMVIAGVDTIDVSDADPRYWGRTLREWLNHTHAFDVDTVATDAARLIAERQRAVQRGLPERSRDNLPFFVIEP